MQVRDLKELTVGENLPSGLMKKGLCRGAKPLCRESEGVPQI